MPGAAHASTRPSVTFETSSPKWRLGSWVSMYSTGAIGGSYRSSATPSARVVLRFDGTSVTWYGHRGPRQGRASVSIDGVDQGSFDAYAPKPGPMQWDFNGLTPGSHRLSIRVMKPVSPSSDRRHVSVDAFSVDGGAPMKQEAVGVSYDSWRTALDPSASRGSYLWSSRIGATLSLRGVTGPGWYYLFARVSPDAGDMYDGLLDEDTGKDFLFSYNTAFLGFGARVLPGSHTMSVTIAATSDRASSGHVVGVDVLKVEPSEGG
jgi:hypothetical protein